MFTNLTDAKNISYFKNFIKLLENFIRHLNNKKLFTSDSTTSKHHDSHIPSRLINFIIKIEERRHPYF
jgi:hypothetical protein